MNTPAFVLIVDDDLAFRTVMAGELTRLGFQVAAAGSGEDAIKAVAEREPQVMLLDLQLPDMSGMDVLKRLRDSQVATEVIMLTGHGSIDTAIQRSSPERSTTC